MKEELSELHFSQPLDVLLVEDNEVDMRITESMLRDNKKAVQSLSITRSLAEAFDNLKEKKVDVIILDLNLPDSSGTETIQKITSQYPDVSIVVNTGAYEEELGISALECGAQDFLVKGRYNGYTLVKALYYSVRRKQLQEELSDANEQLAEAQIQLVQAEKMKVVGGLASGVAHEVRNPLATIVYGITYLKQQLNSDNEDIRTVIESIDEASHRANVIIKDLLDFASLGKLRLDSVMVHDLFERTIELLHHEIKNPELNIIREYDQTIPRVLLDENRVEQVCINIVLNAIVAMERKGELRLRTEALTLTDEHPFREYLDEKKFKSGTELVVMCVEDQGSGIQDDQLKNIFDPFFTTRRARGGVGLGLSVCRNIMRLHHGEIFLKNNVGNGVSANLVFPLK